MKHFVKCTVIILICILLSACSKSGVEDSTPKEDNSKITEVPILSIQTKSTEENAMDFVTKPVSSHVAEQIASWTPNYVMPPEPYYEDCTITLTDADGAVLLDAVDAEVKVRGNWTTHYDKKPLRIKFEDSQNLLGLNDGATFKNWVLLAEYKDASLLRNKTALALAEEFLAESGLYVSDAEFVEVYINGEYWGVYLLAEQQQIDEDRINITEAEDDYTGTDIGYFLEFDAYFYTEDPLQQFTVDYPIYNSQNGFTIKSDIYSEAQRDFIAAFVENVYDIMYAAAYNDEAYIFNETYTAISKTTDISPREAVERVVNVSSLADIYLINELLCDTDLCWSSFPMTVDFGPEGDKKLTFEAPWDYDSSMGLKDTCVNGKEFYAANIISDSDKNAEYNPWLAVLAHEGWYRDIVRDKWTKAYDSGVFERIFSMIETDQARCKAAFDRNYEKWDNINHPLIIDELSKQSAKCTTQEQAAEFLLDWLRTRVEFLNGYLHS